MSSSDDLEVAAGELIIKEGELGNDIFLLLSGSVEIVRDFGGEQQRKLATLEAPNFFGEMSMFECEVRSATVRTTEACTLKVLYSTELYDMFSQWPDQYAILIHRIARQMVHRLRNQTNQFETENASMSAN